MHGFYVEYDVFVIHGMVLGIRCDTKCALRTRSAEISPRVINRKLEWAIKAGLVSSSGGP